MGNKKNTNPLTSSVNEIFVYKLRSVNEIFVYNYWHTGVKEIQDIAHVLEDLDITTDRAKQMPRSLSYTSLMKYCQLAFFHLIIPWLPTRM